MPLRLAPGRAALALSALALSALALSVLALPACDDADPAPASVTFGGVTYTALGGARLAVTGGALAVTNVGASGADGVRVDAPDGALDVADFSVRPVAIGDGQGWGARAFGTVGGQRVALGTAWAQGLGGGRHEIQFDYASALGVHAVVFEYLLGGVLVVRSPEVPLPHGRSALVASAGSSDAQPESVHAIREGGVIVMGTDYRGNSALGAGGCAGALIAVPFQEEAVCADFVRARPLNPGVAFPTAASVEVTGRGIGQFTVTQGRVE